MTQEHNWKTNPVGGTQCERCGQWMGVPVWPPECNPTTEKDWEKLLSERESKMYRYYKSVFVDGFEGGYPMDWDEPLKNYLTTKKAEWKVEEKIAWLEGRRCHTCGKPIEPHPTTDTCADCFENA